MGNYAADHAAIEVLLKSRVGIPSAFSASTRPTDSDVDDMIEQIEGEINGVLSAQGYQTVPATGSSDIKLLKRYVVTKVGAMVWRVVFSEDDAPSHIKRWEEDYAEFLKRLRMGQQYLIDQQPLGEDQPYFQIVRHPTRDDYFTSRDYDERDWDE